MTKRESGAKGSHIKLFTDSRPRDKSGEPVPYAVGLVAQCVAFYRKNMRPIRTIWLHPRIWNEFELWSRYHMSEEESDSTILNYTFDGVFIKEGSPLQKDNIVWDFYPTQKPVVN